MGTVVHNPRTVIRRAGHQPIFLGPDPGDEDAITLADDKVSDDLFTVGAETTVTLWDATASAVSAFSFLWIDTDATVVLELITDQNNGVGKRSATVTVSPESPFVLGSNASYANYTTVFAGGTLDVIDKILVRNNSTTDSAKVRRVVAS